VGLKVLRIYDLGMKIVAARIVDRECANCTGAIRFREFAIDGFLPLGIVYLTPTGIIRLGQGPDSTVCLRHFLCDRYQ
jgi:hypothetical protein